MNATTVECEAPQQRPQAVQKAVEVLRGGGLVVFPTETIYGVGAVLSHGEAMERLRRLKNEQPNNPFTLHLPDASSVGLYVDLQQHPQLGALVRKTMPGPITVIAESDEQTIDSRVKELALDEAARRRLYRGRRISLRCPDHPLTLEVLAAVGEPVMAGSASLPGEPAATTAEQASPLRPHVDLILDCGPTRFAKPSTIVQFDAAGMRVIREGVYDERYLRKLLIRTVLFVCSGNTCRSPMAEAIARQELAERFGVKPERLAEAGVAVISAGAFAMPGSPMTPEARDALEAFGVPVGRHTSRTLTHGLIQEADVIFCMTDSHRAAVLDAVPTAAGKTFLLDRGGNVEDPIGGSVGVYVECAQRLRELIRQRFDEHGLRGPEASTPPAGKDAR